MGAGDGQMGEMGAVEFHVCETHKDREMGDTERRGGPAERENHDNVMRNGKIAAISRFLPSFPRHPIPIPSSSPRLSLLSRRVRRGQCVRRVGRRRRCLALHSENRAQKIKGAQKTQTTPFSGKNFGSKRPSLDGTKCVVVLRPKLSVDLTDLLEFRLAGRIRSFPGIVERR